MLKLDGEESHGTTGEELQGIINPPGYQVSPKADTLLTILQVYSHIFDLHRAPSKNYVPQNVGNICWSECDECAKIWRSVAQESNPGPLAILASTLTTELSPLFISIYATTCSNEHIPLYVMFSHKESQFSRPPPPPSPV